MERILLVLYPLKGLFCPETRGYLAERRRESGLRVVVADNRTAASDDDVLDGFVELPGPEHVKEAFAILSRWCGKHRVEAVYMQTEAALPVGSLLARELGLPGPSVEAVHLCMNKYLSRERLSEHGIPTPQFVLAESAADVYRTGDDFGYPLVLKAVASAHSRLVMLVHSSRDVESAVRCMKAGLLGKSQHIARLSSFLQVANLDPGCSPTEQFLIESFVEGSALESDGLTAEGTSITFGITEQVQSKDPPFYIEGYMCHAERPEADLRELRRLSESSLAAVGLSYSGFSVEMRANADRAWIIEVNGRLGNDDGFSEMFKTRTGVLPTVQALELALGTCPESASGEERCVAVAYRSCYEDGIVEELPDKLQLCGIEREGLTYGSMCKVGTRIYSPPHPGAYPHLAWVQATHPTSSRAAYLTAHAAASDLAISLRSVRP